MLSMLERTPVPDDVAKLETSGMNTLPGTSLDAFIRMEFFRHDDKAKEVRGDPGQNQRVRLSQQGRNHAAEVGRSKQPVPRIAIAWASPRDRAKESALRQMLANDVYPEESLETIIGNIQKEVRRGGKLILSAKLDYNFQDAHPQTRFYQEIYGSSTTQETMPYLLLQSDRSIEQERDLEGTSYLRAAANIAEIVLRYVHIFPRWEAINQQDRAKYQDMQHELQRFLASHGCYVESFLMKVIEGVEGKKAALQFAMSFPKNGKLSFGPSEGYTVQICRKNEKIVVHVTYQQKTWVIQPETLSQIIKERDLMDERIRMRQREK